MNIVVTVDENWAIGNKDRRLARIPGDQRNQQRLTAGRIVVMGRKTLQDMPQGQPLYGRDTIVLSGKQDYRVRGAKVVHSAEELMQELSAAEGEDVYICGGDSLYRHMLAHCDTVYVTMIEKAYEADRYFENLDKSKEWVMTGESDEQTYFDITYYFRKYERRRR